MMRCRKARKLASIRSDGELDAGRTGMLDAHLEACAACRAFNTDLGLLGQGFEGLQVPEPRANFTQRLLSCLPEERTASWIELGWRELIRPVPIAMAAAAFSLGIVLAAELNGAEQAVNQQTDADLRLVAGDYYESLAQASINGQLRGLLQESGE